MNLSQPKILDIIIDAAAETNPGFADVVRQNGIETVLFGRGAQLDSLGLVTLIAAVEARLQDQTGRDLLLVDEEATSRSKSPFRTIQTLIDYIQEKVKQA